MKASYLIEKRKLEMREEPIPEISDGEVLVKIKHCGVCGSDVHYYELGAIGNFVVREPLILGHECAGEVVKAGKDVKNLKVGDRVTLEPGVPCGKCEYCKSGRYNLCPDMHFMATPPINGAFKEYINYPEEFCYKLPDNVDTIEGAMVEPLNCGFHAAQRAGAHIGQTAVVLGSGCIGLCTLMALHCMGVKTVYMFDMIDKRLQMAKKLGATAVFNSRDVDPVKTVMELTGGEGVDLVFEMTGSVSGTQSTLAFAKRGGVVMLVGQGANAFVNYNIDEIIVRELDVRGNFRYANLYPTVIEMLKSGSLPIKDIITDIYSFDDIDKAMEDSVVNKSNIIKAVVEF